MSNINDGFSAKNDDSAVAENGPNPYLSLLMPCGALITLVLLVAICINREKERAKLRAEIEAEMMMKQIDNDPEVPQTPAQTSDHNKLLANIQEQVQRRKSSSEAKFPPSAKPNTANRKDSFEQSEAFVNMVKNAKLIVRLAVDTVSEISKTEDPITADLRSVAELHLAEVAEAWQGITAAENLNDLVLFANFIESKCAIINDLHNTYKTYTTIKKSMATGQDPGLSLNARSSARGRKTDLTSHEDMIPEEDEHGMALARSSAPGVGSKSSANLGVSGSAASITKRHKSRLKKITAKLKAQEDVDPKYRSAAYWMKKVDRMLEKREGSFSGKGSSRIFQSDD